MGLFSFMHKKEKPPYVSGDELLPAVVTDDVGVSKSNWKSVLPDILASSDLTPFARVCRKYADGYPERGFVALAVAKSGNVDALKIVIDTWQLDWAGGGEEVTQVLRTLRTAGQQGHENFWHALLAECRKGRRYAPAAASIACVAAEVGRPALIDSILGAATADQSDIFGAAVRAAVDSTDEAMSFVLSYTGKFREVQEALNDALLQSVKAQSLEKVRALLEKGADPNHAAGICMAFGAQGESKAMIDLLLSHGGDLEKHGKDVLTHLRQMKAQAVLIPYVEEKAREAAECGRRKRMEDRFTLTDPDTVTELQELSADLALTTVFNFRARQQICIAEKKSTGQLAMSVQSFDDLGDVRAIDVAREKLLALGGNDYPRDVAGRHVMDKAYTAPPALK